MSFLSFSSSSLTYFTMSKTSTSVGTVKSTFSIFLEVAFEVSVADTTIGFVYFVPSDISVILFKSRDNLNVTFCE